MKYSLERNQPIKAIYATFIQYVFKIMYSYLPIEEKMKWIIDGSHAI
jgi:hypothetical protein